MVSRHAPDLTYTYASSASKALFGYEPEELVGHTAYAFIHPEDVDDIRGAHSTLLNGGDRVDVRYRDRHKRGDYVECEASARAIRDAGVRCSS
jgi:PAS domain S-box-containing protein